MGGAGLNCPRARRVHHAGTNSQRWHRLVRTYARRREMQERHGDINHYARDDDARPHV